MANIVTPRTVFGSANSRFVYLLITIVADGSGEETDRVIYDNSAFINNPAVGSVVSIEASGSSCQLLFEWDQTTDSPICALDPAASPKFCFQEFGGISNPNGAGATGDIVLTTTNLNAGDVVTILLKIKQS